MRAIYGAGLTALLSLTLLPGCGGTGQVEVEGTVAYDGQPIKIGTITFLAADGKGPNAGGSIVDGKYIIPQKIGPMPGHYRVEIRWAKLTGKQTKSENGELIDEGVEGLPAKYHDKSELTADLMAGKNTVSFDLKK